MNIKDFYPSPSLISPSLILSDTLILWFTEGTLWPEEGLGNQELSEVSTEIWKTLDTISHFGASQIFIVRDPQRQRNFSVLERRLKKQPLGQIFKVEGSESVSSRIEKVYDIAAKEVKEEAFKNIVIISSFPSSLIEALNILQMLKSEKSYSINGFNIVAGWGFQEYLAGSLSGQGTAAFVSIIGDYNEVKTASTPVSIIKVIVEGLGKSKMLETIRRTEFEPTPPIR